MTQIAPPRTGESVSILAPHARLRGWVADGSDAALTVELEQTPIRRPFRFPAGSPVEIEWVHELGVMQMAATVGAAREEPGPTLDLELAGLATPVAERRADERRSVTLHVSAWSPAKPTVRLEGRTVDLSLGGALLHLPGLAPLAATVDLRIGLPAGPLAASASVRWRRQPDLVGARFERIDPAMSARLVDFLG